MNNRLPDDVLRIVIDNVDPAPAHAVLDWAQQTIAYFETEHGLAREKIVIRHLGNGTTTLELWFVGLGALGAGISAVSAVGIFALAYANSLKQGDRRTAPSAVYIIDNNRGNQVIVCSGASEPMTVRISEIGASLGVDTSNGSGEILEPLRRPGDVSQKHGTIAGADFAASRALSVGPGEEPVGSTDPSGHFDQLWLFTNNPPETGPFVMRGKVVDKWLIEPTNRRHQIVEVEAEDLPPPDADVVAFVRMRGAEALNPLTLISWRHPDPTRPGEKIITVRGELLHSGDFRSDDGKTYQLGPAPTSTWELGPGRMELRAWVDNFAGTRLQPITAQRL